MEVRELARLVLLLVTALERVIKAECGEDAGGKKLLDEIRAFAELYAQRTRLAALPAYTDSPRGAAMLAAADERAAANPES